METKNIFKAIAAIMNDVEPIGKTKKNQQQGFMYRGIDDMYNELQPLFVKHKVFITSEVLESQREERQTKNGGALIYTILKVKFTFYAEDGSNISSTMTGEAMDSADKSANKSMSVALKYCLMQLLLIPTEDLKKLDPDATTHELQPKTTMNNHQQLGTPDKPLITNKQFAQLMDKIRGGDDMAFDKAKKLFSFEKKQNDEAFQETQKLINQLQTV